MLVFWLIKIATLWSGLNLCISIRKPIFNWEVKTLLLTWQCFAQHVACYECTACCHRDKPHSVVVCDFHISSLCLPVESQPNVAGTDGSGEDDVLSQKPVSGAIHWMTRVQYRLGSSSGKMAVARSSHPNGKFLLVQWNMQELQSNILLVWRKNSVLNAVFTS